MLPSIFIARGVGAGANNDGSRKVLQSFFWQSGDTRQHDCLTKIGKENIAPGRGRAGLPLRLNLQLNLHSYLSSAPR